MAKSDIVFGSEFSPAVVELPRVLEIVADHQPSFSEIRSAINSEFFAGKPAANPAKSLGHNTVLAMIAYQILQRGDSAETVTFTEFGQDLFENRGSQSLLGDMMAKHCLANLKGVRLISCIRDLQSAQIPLKKTTIARRLREEGFHIPENGKHLNILRQWLEFGGVLNAGHAAAGEALWIADNARIDSLLGVTAEDVDKWSELSAAQYDFARAFALMGVDESISSDVRDTAVSLYGTEFPEGGLPQSVLHKLEEVGLIAWQKTTSGRGAKAHKVRATKKLKSELLEPILAQIAGGFGAAYRRLSRMSLASIVAALGSHDTHEKGIALEALAFYFCRRLDLQFVQWRLRGNMTGGAEVDVVVEGTRLLFSRWQIQCKNTERVTTDDLAKEIGVATAIKSNVVMLVSTGKIGAAVQKFAGKVMENTSLHVVLINGTELSELTERPGELLPWLNERATEAMTLKRCQIED